MKLNHEEIEQEQLAVFFEDECHLLWGDACGYVWGKKEERVSIAMTNERMRQTYYGAVNLLNGECITKEYERGNSENTRDFIEHLLLKNEGKRIAIIWDGASYHRSEEIRKYLQSLNDGLEETKWKVTCIRLAPNCPQQNPMEDIWLQGKRFIREFYHLCKSFKIVKYLFQFSTNNNIFNFPKIFIYGNFSQMI